jgi:hypothetical protein
VKARGKAVTTDPDQGVAWFGPRLRGLYGERRY